MFNIKLLINSYKNIFKGSNIKLLYYLLIKSISSSLVLLLPILLGEIIDIILKEDLQKLYYILLLILIINLIISIFSILENKLKIKIANDVSLKMKPIVLNKILYLKINNLKNTKQGEYISKIEDIDNIINNYLNIVNTFFSDILGFIISAIIMISISPILSILCIINFIITFFIQNKFFKNISKVEKDYKSCMDNYYTLLSKVFNNIKEIKNLVIENKVRDIYINDLKTNINISIKKSNISIKLNFISSIINNLFNVLLIFISMLLIIYKKITIGNYVTFNSYIAKFNYGLSKLCTLNFDIKMLQVYIERLNTLMELDDENHSNINKNEIINDSLKITIKNLKFSYKNSNIYDLNIYDEIIFKNNSLNFIIGKNGSGKTTLVNLLMKFYEFEGDIIINEHNINDLSLSSLRSNIIYISQNMFIFNISIEDNFKLINENITREMIEEACKKVELHNYILSLPNGYETILNDNSIVFSSGQLQKLSIARALLSNKKIIIFDESNSFLDINGHKLFFKLLEEASINHTVIVITHKLKYIDSDFYVVIMDNGKVIQKGYNLELLKYDNQYKEYIE